MCRRIAGGMVALVLVLSLAGNQWMEAVPIAQTPEYVWLSHTSSGHCLSQGMFENWFFHNTQYIWNTLYPVFDTAAYYQGEYLTGYSYADNTLDISVSVGWWEPQWTGVASGYFHHITLSLYNFTTQGYDISQTVYGTEASSGSLTNHFVQGLDADHIADLAVGVSYEIQYLDSWPTVAWITEMQTSYASYGPTDTTSTIIPEPASLTLLGLALAGAFALVRARGLGPGMHPAPRRGKCE